MIADCKLPQGTPSAQVSNIGYWLFPYNYHIVVRRSFSRTSFRMTDKGGRTGHVILRDKRLNGKTLRKYG
jgi:hypothetical protein